MQEAQQISSTDEGEETLVTPRFDKEETSVAQPVVPLDKVRRVAASRMASLRLTRPRLLALALTSALVGIVLGGVGIYFYQSRSSASPVASAPEPVSATAEVEQPSPAPTAEVLNVSQMPAPVEGVKQNAPASDATTRDVVSKREPARESAPTKTEGADGESDAAAKPGKKGEGDVEDAADQPEQKTRRDALDTQGPIPEDSSPAARRARRVEEGLRGVERTRERQRRRRDNAANSAGGSIESIFEGRP